MIIVSQNKDKIVNFDNITFLDIDKSNGMYIVKCNVINENRVYLGEYVTVERAKEVLQEITKTYFDENCEFENGIYHLQKIYEMPKE